jgi:hypothetical protein
MGNRRGRAMRDADLRDGEAVAKMGLPVFNEA